MKFPLWMLLILLCEQIIRIGHPDGVAEVRVALTEDAKDIAYVGMDRTARRIMKGDLFIPSV